MFGWFRRRIEPGTSSIADDSGEWTEFLDAIQAITKDPNAYAQLDTAVYEDEGCQVRVTFHFNSEEGSNEMKTDELQQLQNVRDWAHEKIRAGKSPPWVWFEYMKLREVLDNILKNAKAAESAKQAASGEAQQEILDDAAQ